MVFRLRLPTGDGATALTGFKVSILAIEKLCAGQNGKSNVPITVFMPAEKNPVRIQDF